MNKPVWLTFPGVFLHHFNNKNLFIDIFSYIFDLSDNLFMPFISTGASQIWWLKLHLLGKRKVSDGGRYRNEQNINYVGVDSFTKTNIWEKYWPPGVWCCGVSGGCPLFGALQQTLLNHVLNSCVVVFIIIILRPESLKLHDVHLKGSWPCSKTRTFREGVFTELVCDQQVSVCSNWMLYLSSGFSLSTRC